MTTKERIDALMETGEFDFIKELPSEQFWKLMFFMAFICEDAKG